jgi:hypothetical protein
MKRARSSVDGAQMDAEENRPDNVSGSVLGQILVCAFRMAFINSSA